MPPMIDWDKTSTEIRENPSVLHARISRLEHRDLARDQTHTHLGYIMSRDVKTPVGPVPLILALGVLLLVAIKPEVVSTFLPLR